MDFKIGDLVLYVCDDQLPSVGMVAEIGKELVDILSIPSYSRLNVEGKHCYRIDYIKKLLNQ